MSPFADANKVPDAFFDYLIKTWTPNKAEQDRHVGTLVRSVLDRAREEYELRVNQAINSMRTTAVAPDFKAIFIGVMQEFTDECTRNPPSECFADTSMGEIRAYHDEEIERAILSVFSGMPNPSEEMELVKRLACSFLHHDIYSDLFTGIVFAGFGHAEMFPSLFSYEMDGIIHSRLKKRRKHKIVTSQGEPSAEIIPFAQRDIVDRYLEGMDSEFEHEVSRYFEETLGIVEAATILPG